MIRSLLCTIALALMLAGSFVTTSSANDCAGRAALCLQSGGQDCNNPTRMAQCRATKVYVSETGVRWPAPLEGAKRTVVKASGGGDCAAQGKITCKQWCDSRPGAVNCMSGAAGSCDMKPQGANTCVGR